MKDSYGYRGRPGHVAVEPSIFKMVVKRLTPSGEPPTGNEDGIPGPSWDGFNEDSECLWVSGQIVGGVVTTDTDEGWEMESFVEERTLERTLRSLASDHEGAGADYYYA